MPCFKKQKLRIKRSRSRGRCERERASHRDIISQERENVKMKKCKRMIEQLRRERELDMLNDPRRMVFLSDVLYTVLLFAVAFVVTCGGVYVFGHMMYGLQKLFGIA